MAFGGIPAGAWNLIGAFVGVFLGQLLTMWWDRRKERARKEDSRRTTEKSILEELKQVQRNVAACESSRVPDIAYPTGAYRSGVASGRFALLDQDDQLAVSEVYGAIERAEQDQEQLRRARSETDVDTEYVRQLQFQFDDRIEALEDEIPDVIRRLENNEPTA